MSSYSVRLILRNPSLRGGMRMGVKGIRRNSASSSRGWGGGDISALDVAGRGSPRSAVQYLIQALPCGQARMGRRPLVVLSIEHPEAAEHAVQAVRDPLGLPHVNIALLCEPPCLHTTRCRSTG